LVGDARATLQALLPRLERNPDRAFLEQAQEGMRDWWALMEQRGTRTETPMKPQVVAWHLAEALDDDAIVCGDSGQVTYWVEQMAFLGNPEYGVDFAPVDFVKVAEGCGAHAVHIEDPATCGEQLREALAHPGPVVVEAVVDDNEPPLPAKITTEQAKLMYDAL